MKKKVVVWGTGNVGRPAIRAVLSHAELELVGVIVSNDAKVGRDAGELAGVAPVGVTATKDAGSVLTADVDAVVYAASADIRPDEAMADLLQCLFAGCNVVSTSFYDFLHPALVPEDAMAKVAAATNAGSSSLFVSGIDPGPHSAWGVAINGGSAPWADAVCTPRKIDARHTDTNRAANERSRSSIARA